MISAAIGACPGDRPGVPRPAKACSGDRPEVPVAMTHNKGGVTSGGHDVDCKASGSGAATANHDESRVASGQGEHEPEDTQDLYQWWLKQKQCKGSQATHCNAKHRGAGKR